MMRIVVQRNQLLPDRTMGQLIVSDKHYCWTLEDAVRERYEGGKWIWKPQFKVPRHTAIPSGRYRLSVNLSTRFKRDMPYVANVPDFTGIRIHNGASPAHTEGCILLGRSVVDNTLINSTSIFEEFLSDLLGWLRKEDEVWLTVTNPMGH